MPSLASDGSPRTHPARSDRGRDSQFDEPTFTEHIPNTFPSQPTSSAVSTSLTESHTVEDTQYETNSLSTPRILGLLPCVAPPPRQAPVNDSMGGPNWNPDLQRWRKIFRTGESGQIVVTKTSDYEQLKHLAPSLPEVLTALTAIENLTRSTGKLYCEVSYKNRVTQEFSLTTVLFSGFWIEGNKFLTCAHFLDIVPDTDTRETLRRLQHPAQANAYVSMAEESNQEIEEEIVPVCPVRLLFLDHESDLALFVLNDHKTANSSEQAPRPKHCIAIADLHPLTAIENVSSTNFIATYYPADEMTGNLRQTWENMGEKCSGAYGAGTEPRVPPPIFAPNFRSIGFGGLVAAAGASNSLTQIWNCSIPGFFGCSGGPVSTLELDNGTWKTRVIGLFRGESENDLRYNNVLAFTAAGVDKCRARHSEDDLEAALARL